MAPPPPSPSKSYWVVVADESRAVIYTRERRRSPLIEMTSLSNAQARKKTGDLISDRGGRSFDSHGQGRHTMAKEKSDPKQHSAAVFAKQIAERIGRATHDGSLRGYALVAAPRFLGLLRDALSHASNVEPYATVDKEMVGHGASDIGKLLDNL